MDPRHRDRLAFLRIVSGTFEKDMEVFHARLGRMIRMTRPHRLFARERETVEAAYPGDVIGFVNPGLFRIGDSVSSDGKVEFEQIPRFTPEHFGTLRVTTTSRQKQFQKGIAQLEEEGAIQLFFQPDGPRSEPVVGVVGELQFDVLRSRLEAEYGAETTLHRLPYRFVRWLDGPADRVEVMRLPGQTRRAEDAIGRPVALFTGMWELEIAMKENPALRFHESSAG